MINANIIKQNYEHLDISKATHDRNKYQFLKDRYLCIWGETLFDTKDGFGIQIVGDVFLGKTSTILSLIGIGKRFKWASRDRAIFDYKNQLITTDYWQNELSIPEFEQIDPFKLKRLIQFIKKGETKISHNGLEKSLEYIQKELGVPSMIFERTENNIRETALRLYEKLIG